MLDVVKSSLDYMLLLESETDLASPVVEALLELTHLMDSAIEEEEIHQCGRPRIVIEKISSPFWWRMVSALVTLQASFCVVVALLNEE